MEVGVSGINSRAVCESAKKLGFEVFLADYFYAQDISADHHYPMQEDPLRPDLREYSKEKLAEYAIEKLSGKVGCLLATSELGCDHLLLEKLSRHFSILGNQPEKVRRAKDWKMLEKALEKCGIKYPKTHVADSVRDLEDASEDIGFPLVVKGLGVPAQTVYDVRGFDAYLGYGFHHPLWAQEKIEGEPISASILSAGKESVCLSVNRQLIGTSEFGARGFEYAGNIVPLRSGSDEEIGDRASDLVRGLGLIGSNGVDFIRAGGDFYFMEVNPRFQDTLEGVEKYRRINLVEAHLKALDGELIDVGEGRGVYGKAVLYARKDCVASSLPSNAGDIPSEGARILAGQPLCSLYSEGADAFSDLADEAGRVFFRCSG